MNVYQILIITLVVFILLYEMIPAAQTKIQLALNGTHKRVKELREFIDDDDYNVLNEFCYCPFTMEEYLSERESSQWCEIKANARMRQRQGWGSPYFDGPDLLEPLRFWWHRGTLIRRSGLVMPSREDRSDRRAKTKSPPPPPPVDSATTLPDVGQQDSFATS
jgi:hypothetical protein